MGRALGFLTGASLLEGLNLLADHHWLFGAAAGLVAFISSRRLKGHGVA